MTRDDDRALERALTPLPDPRDFTSLEWTGAGLLWIGLPLFALGLAYWLLGV